MYLVKEKRPSRGGVKDYTKGIVKGTRVPWDLGKDYKESHAKSETPENLGNR